MPVAQFSSPTFFRALGVVRRLLVAAFFSLTVGALCAQPASAPVATIPIDELRPGQRGQVWTVFRGTEPEPFEVEVTGVVRNALGPGKSLIICQLTDSRVQNMGAVAGMSGSPLYIDGRLAGALSYQIQRFETVRHAGFTPAADLTEVRDKPDLAPSRPPAVPLTSVPDPLTPRPSPLSAYQPLRPVFTLSGLAPVVADLFAPRFTALGLDVTSLGGSTSGAPVDNHPTGPAPLRAGSAIAVALATGDITLAGTGTVSRVAHA